MNNVLEVVTDRKFGNTSLNGYEADIISYSDYYPHNSPYAFSENRLIDCIELEGLEAVKASLASGAVAGLSLPVREINHATRNLGFHMYAVTGNGTIIDHFGNIAAYSSFGSAKYMSYVDELDANNEKDFVMGASASISIDFMYYGKEGATVLDVSGESTTYTTSLSSSTIGPVPISLQVEYDISSTDYSALGVGFGLGIGFGNSTSATTHETIVVAAHYTEWFDMVEQITNFVTNAQKGPGSTLQIEWVEVPDKEGYYQLGLYYTGCELDCEVIDVEFKLLENGSVSTDNVIKTTEEN